MWTPPTELPNLSDCSGLVVDFECRDDGLRDDIGSGWPWRGGYVCGIAVGPHDDDRQWYLPIRHQGGGNLDPEVVLRWARDTLNQERGWGYLFHGSLYDHGWGSTEDLNFPGISRDSQFAACLLDENRFAYNLDVLAKEIGHPGKDLSLEGAGCESLGLPITTKNYRANLWQMHSQYVGPYAEGDVAATRALWNAQAPEIEAQGLAPVFRLECDLIPMLTAMRARGIRIDTDEVDRLDAEFTNLSETYPQIIRDRYGVKVTSPKAPSQLGPAMDTLGIPYKLTAKSKKPSITKAFVKDHPHPFIKDIGAWREIKTIQSLCLNGISKNLHGDRIHPELSPLKIDNDDGRTTRGTVTGRFACSNPNAQQVSGRTELGAKVRGCYLPEVGEQWASPDISQQEPLLVVHYSMICGLTGAEEAGAAWIEGYNRWLAGGKKIDWHQMVADMTGLSRNDAKPINLGVTYGMMAKKLGDNLGISFMAAQKMLDEYHGNMPFISELMDRCAAKAEAVGYITTLYGRRCRFPLFEPKYNRKRHPGLPYDEAADKWGEDRIKRARLYVALNRVIQGGSADWVKLAMRECWREGIIPILQVHDELALSVTCKEEAQKVSEIMRDAVDLRLPAIVDFNLGASWMDAK